MKIHVLRPSGLPIQDLTTGEDFVPYKLDLISVSNHTEALKQLKESKKKLEVAIQKVRKKQGDYYILRELGAYLTIIKEELEDFKKK